MISRRLIAAVSAVVLTGVVLCAVVLDHVSDSPVDAQAQVALYSDRGASAHCLQATEKMICWMGFSVDLVDAEDINTDNLDGYSILCMPGGNMCHYSQDISAVGKANVRDFVRSGGGYIGICGGAYFAFTEVVWRGDRLSMAPLALLSGTAMGPIDEIAPYPDRDICRIDIVCSSHPITQSEPESWWMLYASGPALDPDEHENVTILGEYNRGDQSAMLAFSYGTGRAFLVGTHPEFEEDSDRDGLDYCDEFDDRGSDWDLMRKAVFWSMKEPFS